MNSIPYSIKTIYSYSRHFLGITPRGDSSQVPAIQARIEEEAPVPVDRIMTARVSGIEVKSIVGGWPFVVHALNDSDMTYYLDRMDAELVEGRLPSGLEAGAVVSKPILENLDLKMGDSIMAPGKREAYAPQEVPIVGVVETREWLVLVPLEYHKEHHFPPIDVLIVWADDIAEQQTLDRWANDAFSGLRAQVFAYYLLEEDTDTMFAILYKILNVVIGLLVVVITLMIGMLMNIYQSQRVQEFGLLLAIGFGPKRLVRRVLGESLIVTVGGWVLGVICAFALLTIVKKILMDPNAFALDVWDKRAYLYTLPVPVAIFFVAIGTLVHRMRKFDPVAILERRLV